MFYSFDRYGFKESSWKPTDSIKVLIEELKLHGLLGVIGRFGSNFYRCSSKVIEGLTLDGGAVYTWKRGSPTKERTTCYNIILVGTGAASSCEIVYYLDPED